MESETNSRRSVFVVVAITKKRELYFFFVSWRAIFSPILLPGRRGGTDNCGTTSITVRSHFLFNSSSRYRKEWKALFGEMITRSPDRYSSLNNYRCNNRCTILGTLIQTQFQKSHQNSRSVCHRAIQFIDWMRDPLSKSPLSFPFCPQLKTGAQTQRNNSEGYYYYVQWESHRRPLSLLHCASYKTFVLFLAIRRERVRTEGCPEREREWEKGYYLRDRGNRKRERAHNFLA